MDGAPVLRIENEAVSNVQSGMTMLLTPPVPYSTITVAPTI